MLIVGQVTDRKLVSAREKCKLGFRLEVGDQMRLGLDDYLWTATYSIFPPFLTM